MPGTRRRKGIVSSDNTEDGSSQSRSQSRSSNSHSRIMFHNTTQYTQGYNNISNNLISSDASCKQPKNAPRDGDTSSSENEGEESSNSSRYRPFSNYETSESLDRSSRPEDNMTKTNEQESDLTCHQHFSDSDSLSDDSIVRPRIVKSLKRPISPTSTSDSSDSGLPLASRRYVKRMKLFSSSESISESSIDSDYNIGTDVRNELMDNTSNSKGINPSRSLLAINSRLEGNGPDIIPGISVRSLRARRIPVVESESESDIASTSHTIRRRRISAAPQPGMSSTVSSIQNVAQRVSSELDVCDTRRRRRSALPSQENESDSSLNVSDRVIRTYNYIRGRRVVDSSMNPEFGGQNVWRVRSQIEGTEAVGDTVGRRGMRRRSPVVESDDDSDSLSNTNNSEILNPNESNQGVSRLSFMIRLCNPYTSGPTDNIRRRRRVNYSNNMNHDFGSPNVWRVRTNVEETEDDDISVSISRRVIGRRIPVVESEDDADSLSNTNNQGRIIPNEGDEVASSGLESNAINLSRRVSVFPSDDESNNISNDIVRTIEREEESNTSDSDIRPRALSNRLAPIFQSDDSSFTSLSSSTESDDSIPIRNPRRRNRPIPIVDYEDIGNDLIGFDVNIKASTVVKVLSKNEVHNRNSSDTDTELEKCPICLAGFKLQEIGKPISCDHKFCSLCIKEWATKNNTCPVDRKVFNGIVVYDKIEGNIVCELPVEKATPPEYIEFEIIQEFPTDSSDESSLYFDSDGDGPEEICYVCGNSFRPHRMISCDACNHVYHLECVDPPMRDFPTINWYCSLCD